MESGGWPWGPVSPSEALAVPVPRSSGRMALGSESEAITA